jgi:steroid delta-isomerase-like uncharacterized protein
MNVRWTNPKQRVVIKVEAKDLVATYIEEVWNCGDLEALANLTTADFVYHLGGQPPRDRAGMKQFLGATRAAFPDWRVEIESIVSEGSVVAARWRGEVTHLGPFHGAPATGRKISVTGINFYRLEGGKVAQEWEETDSLGMLGQLGMLPT